MRIPLTFILIAAPRAALATDYSGVTVVLATPVMVVAAVVFGALCMFRALHRYLYRSVIALAIPVAVIGLLSAFDGLSNIGTIHAKYSYIYYGALIAATVAFVFFVRRHGSNRPER